MRWVRRHASALWVLATTLVAASPASHAAPQQGKVLRWVGIGVQIYACKHVDERYAWSLLRPEATLTDDNGQVQATHGAGPHWTASDGSAVYGAVLTAVPAPSPGAIPWLVLRASKHEGDGLMSDVAFILRTDTDGGAAPATGCDAGHENAELRTPYRATYTFLVEPAADAG